MRVSTDLLPSVSAVTATYTCKNSHLGFNCNLAVSRNKTFCNGFSTYYAHHIDFITVVYRVFDWKFLELYFILFYSILFL